MTTAETAIAPLVKIDDRAARSSRSVPALHRAHRRVVAAGHALRRRGETRPASSSARAVGEGDHRDDRRQRRDLELGDDHRLGAAGPGGVHLAPRLGRRWRRPRSRSRSSPPTSGTPVTLTHTGWEHHPRRRADARRLRPRLGPRARPLRRARGGMITFTSGFLASRELQRSGGPENPRGVPVVGAQATPRHTVRQVGRAACSPARAASSTGRAADF